MAREERRDPFTLPIKSTIVLIRWPVVIISCYLVLYRTEELLPNYIFEALVLLYIASNLALYFVRENYFHQPAFYASVVLLDTIVLTLSLIVNGQVETDFYLAYFLLIIICCLFENPKMVATISILAPVVYAGLLFQTSDYQPAMYLRLPFLFVVALFYGYFTQLVRTQKMLREEAERRNDAKLELLNVVSHELRTPLTIINGFAEALKNKVLGEINPEQDEALDKVMRQAKNLLSIMNVILDTAGIETGGTKVQNEEFLLSSFLDELKAGHEETVKDGKVTLTWDYPTPLPVVISDKGKLRIILENLIGNAIKFTDKGEVRVSARCHPERKVMIFTVADTGIGIPEAQVPFIFDKFWQADASLSKTYGGMGLGLYILKSYLDLLGGTISVESDLGKGAKFVVMVPSES